jgi:hypothetical protein
MHNEKGAIGWILLWVIGMPIPLLLLLFWFAAALDRAV